MPVPLVVPQHIQHALIEHAKRDFPREAVGMLGGHGTAVTHAAPLQNCARGLGAFLANPYEQFKTERSWRREGLEILAIYHSHPAGGVLPSDTDLAFAAAWPCAHVIIAISASNTAARMSAYRWDHGELRGVPLEPNLQSEPA